MRSSADVVLFFDASGMAKRYFEEIGSDTLNALFMSLPVPSMATTPWGYSETYAIFLLGSTYATNYVMLKQKITRQLEALRTYIAIHLANRQADKNVLAFLQDSEKSLMSQFFVKNNL